MGSLLTNTEKTCYQHIYTKVSREIWSCSLKSHMKMLAKRKPKGEPHGTTINLVIMSAIEDNGFSLWQTLTISLK